jgi:hypothetical protein
VHCGIRTAAFVESAPDPQFRRARGLISRANEGTNLTTFSTPSRTPGHQSRASVTRSRTTQHDHCEATQSGRVS